MGMMRRKAAMVTVKHSHHDHHPHDDQVVLDEVYKSKKEKSADTLSAESEETQVVFSGKAFWNLCSFHGMFLGGKHNLKNFSLLNAAKRPSTNSRGELPPGTRRKRFILLPLYPSYTDNLENVFVFSPSFSDNLENVQ